MLLLWVYTCLWMPVPLCVFAVGLWGGGGQMLLVNGLAKSALGRCGNPFASFPNWVSLSCLAAGREKAAAVHFLCQHQQIGFLQFQLLFPNPNYEV